jgi:hypothetical protein
MQKDLKRPGTVEWSLRVPPGFWESVGDACSFPTFGARDTGVYAETAILSDQTIDVQIDGPLGRFWELRSQPITGKPAMMWIAVTWRDEEVKLYVDGVLHQQKMERSEQSS